MRIHFRALSIAVLGLSFFCASVFAAEYVTWNGTQGVQQTGNFSTCTSACHSTTTSNDYTSYTDSSANSALIVDKIGASPSSGVQMPLGGPYLSASEISFISTWNSNGARLNATPHAVTQVSTSISDGRFNRRISGRVNMNGNNTTNLYLEYRVSGIDPYQQAGGPQPASNSGGGGAATASRTNFSRDISGLTCNTTYQYRVRVNSPAATSSSSTFTTSACQPPTFNSGGSVNRFATEDTYFSYTPTTTDTDGGSRTFSLSSGSLPTGMNLNSSTGQITWTPTEGQTSTSFTIRVTDSTSPSYNYQTVNISVTAVNDPPALGTVSNLGGVEGIQITRQIPVSDPDDTNNGSNLSWSLNNAPSGMSISNTGLISWTPQEGFIGPQTVTVQVSDGQYNDSDTFNATATAVNDVPVITSSAPATATEEVNYSYQLTFNDPDAGDSHSFSLSGEPSGMTVSNTGLISWTPDDGDLPSANNITITVTDSGSFFDSETFSIAITAVNDQPTITSTATPSVLEGALYSYQLSVLDPDDTNWPSDLVFYLLNEPSGMTVDQNGLITWQTAEADPSPATITVGVRDNGEDGTIAFTQDFDVTVIAYNYQPAITSTAPISATEDVTYTYQLTVYDVDDANDGSGALNFSLNNEPTGMTVSNTGLVSWTATEGITSSGLVTVSVNDAGEDGTVAATENFTIAVTAVNDAPVITSTAVPDVIEMNTYTYQVTVADPDDLDPASDLSFVLTNAPAGMTVSNTGLISWYAPEAAGTSGNVTLTVSDGGEDAAAPAVEIFNVNVIIFNTAPVITSQAPATATEDTLYQYQATVDDIDDANDGVNLSWSLSNAPLGMQVSPTGLVSWTPTEGITSSGTVTLTVTDGGEDAAQPFAENFSISVVAVNDAPLITSTPPSSAIQGVLFSHQVLVQDPDDTNNGSNLLFSLSGQPPGMLISSTGLLTWTPDASSPASNNITIRVADGGEDGAQVASLNFTLSVVFDIDQDGILNADDNCELVSNPDQANNDGDAEGDLCDFDDDNDGMSDSFENANGFDPFDPRDASLDADGDGLTNLQEFLEGSNPFGDDNPPRITLPRNNLWYSTGYETWVDIGQAVATDSLDGTVSVTPSRSSGGFRPGRHEIIWTASDSSGNVATATQVIKVLPLIALAPKQFTGEGKTLSVSLSLNGDAPEDPATVNYSVSGTSDSSDHNATNGTLSFVNGRAEIAIDILTDAVTESAETLVISLHNPINATLGAVAAQEITISEISMAPRVRLQVMQAGETGSIVNRVEGNITINAVLDDINVGDTFSFDWSQTDNNLVAVNASGTTTSSTFEFDPAAISTGLHLVAVTVTDSSGLAASANILLSVQSSTSATDVNDNGILDSADSSSVAYALQATGGQILIQTAPYLTLSLGDTARYADLVGAALTVQNVQFFGNNGFQAANGQTAYSFTGGLYDLSLSGLNSGDSASLLIEQQNILEAASEFRVYEATSGWTNFVEDEFNFIESAAAVDGVCPPIGDLDYESGLIEGYLCIQLTIQDGGPNDSDSRANGKVNILGGAGIIANSENDNSESGGNSSGSGSMGYFIWLILGGLIACRCRQKSE